VAIRREEDSVRHHLTDRAEEAGRHPTAAMHPRAGSVDRRPVVSPLADARTTCRAPHSHRTTAAPRRAVRTAGSDSLQP
jgi:hypothetical protein